MATTVRASNTNSATTGTAISVTAPAGTTTGDVVIVSVHANTQTTIADNNGATAFTEDINDYKPDPIDGHTVSVFSRRIQAGDPTTYNFTSGASGRWSIIAVTFQNPNASSIYDVAPSTSNANNIDNQLNGNISAPSITTLTDNAIHCALAWVDSQPAIYTSHPAGYTVERDATNQPQSFCYKVITPAGATGSQAFVTDQFAARIAMSFAIKDIGTTDSYSGRGVGRGIGRGIFR